jgi:glycosyltransferase involved in cell wall biosynthesis
MNHPKSNPWIVIPCRDEGKNLAILLPELDKIPAKILVVDDGSTDNTRESCRANNVACLVIKPGKGKGYAARAGCEVAFHGNATSVVLMDGDGEHDPSDASSFLEKMKNQEKSLVVFGHRNDRRGNIFSLGNKVLAFILRLLHEVYLKDSLCGYKAFNLPAYKKIIWEDDGYFIEAEIAIRTKREKVSYLEIPIKTLNRQKRRGTTPLTGIVIATKLVIAKFRYRSVRTK